MLRFTTVIPLTVLALILAGPGFSEDDAPPAPTMKVRLPNHWAKLSLSDEQKQAVYAIRKTYAARSEPLKRQLMKLREQETAELAKLLTEEQLAALRRLVLEKALGRR